MAHFETGVGYVLGNDRKTPPDSEPAGMGVADATDP